MSAIGLALTGGPQNQWWQQFGKTPIYVSNVASNGYGLGNDSTGNGQKTTPYLTIAKALSTASDGAVVILNGSGSTYQENSGSGYLAFPATAAVVVGDFGLSKPTIACTGSATRVVNIPTTAKAIAFWNVVLDGTGTSSGNIVEPNNQTVGGLTFGLVDFRNASGRAIDAFIGSSNVLNIKGCTFDTSVATAFTANASNLTFASLSVTGNTFTGSGSATGIQISGQSTVTTLTFSNNNASGTFGQAVLVVAGDSTVTTLTANYNSGSPSGGMVSLASENIGATEVAFNNIQTPSGASRDPIAVSPTGTSSLAVHDNVVTVNSSSSIHGILIGPDGYLTDSQNTTSTGSQNLGDVSGNTYVDEAFTTSAAATSTNSRASYFAGILITLKKAGSPTGTISAKLYADNAGAPGSLIETSVTTVAGNNSLVTTSFQQFFFEFSSHNKLAVGTKYHLVLKYTGTVNNTDYIVLSKNGTTTGGNLSTAPDGTTWTADASHALLYVIYSGCFGTTSINAYNNSVTMAAGANTTTHGILLGCVNFTAAYRNQVYGGGICMIAKNCYAGLMYDNLCYTAVGTLEVFRLKGSFNIQVYQNSGIQGAASATAVAFRADNNNANGVNAPVSSAFDVENNIWACVGTGYVYSLGSGATGTINHNSVWNAPSSAGIEQNNYSAWAAWQGAGFDANSVNSTPSLPALAGATSPADFVPPSNSSVGGIGANLSATVVSDFNSKIFSATPPAGALNLAA